MYRTVSKLGRFFFFATVAGREGGGVAFFFSAYSQCSSISRAKFSPTQKRHTHTHWEFFRTRCSICSPKVGLWPSALFSFFFFLLLALFRFRSPPITQILSYTNSFFFPFPFHFVYISPASLQLPAMAYNIYIYIYFGVFSFFVVPVHLQSTV